MKMIILIVKDSLTEALTRALTGAQFRVTCIASTGGFLRSGVSTLLIGLDASQLDPAIAVIRSALAVPASAPLKVMPKALQGEGHGTLFVVPVSRFEQV